MELFFTWEDVYKDIVGKERVLFQGLFPGMEYILFHERLIDGDVLLGKDKRGKILFLRICLHHEPLLHDLKPLSVFIYNKVTIRANKGGT
jgi:hypothetical protein